MALVAGGITGILRTMLITDESKAKVTPVDFVINSTIASVWRRSLERSGEILFFNCDADKSAILWRDKFKILGNYKIWSLSVPCEKLLWYPRLSLTKSFVWHKMSLLLFQLLPAVLFDTMLLLSGNSV